MEILRKTFKIILDKFSKILEIFLIKFKEIMKKPRKFKRIFDKTSKIMYSGKINFSVRNFENVSIPSIFLQKSGKILKNMAET